MSENESDAIINDEVLEDLDEEKTEDEEDTPAAAAAAAAAPPAPKVKRPTKRAKKIDAKTFGDVNEFIKPKVDNLKLELTNTLDDAWVVLMRSMLADKIRRISTRAEDIRAAMKRFTEIRERIATEIVMDG